MIAVRKKPKAYGAFANEYVEGPYHAGQRVLLLEDVVTSGTELLAAAQRLRELGLEVMPYAVVSRGLAPVRALIGFSLPRSEPKPKTNPLTPPLRCSAVVDENYRAVVAFAGSFEQLFAFPVRAGVR